MSRSLMMNIRERKKFILERFFIFSVFIYISWFHDLPRTGRTRRWFISVSHVQSIWSECDAICWYSMWSTNHLHAHFIWKFQHLENILLFLIDCPEILIIVDVWNSKHGELMMLSIFRSITKLTLIFINYCCLSESGEFQIYSSYI